jgi:hypothetical protein
MGDIGIFEMKAIIIRNESVGLLICSACGGDAGGVHFACSVGSAVYECEKEWK